MIFVHICTVEHRSTDVLYPTVEFEVILIMSL